MNTRKDGPRSSIMIAVIVFVLASVSGVPVCGADGDNDSVGLGVAVAHLARRTTAQQGVRELEHLPSAEVVSAVVTALRTDSGFRDDGLRLMAYEVLAAHGAARYKEGLTQLIRGLDDRWTVAECLKAFRDIPVEDRQRAVASLMLFLDHKLEDVRIAPNDTTIFHVMLTCSALIRLSAREALPRLQIVVANVNELPKIREYALEAIVGIGGSAAFYATFDSVATDDNEGIVLSRTEFLKHGMLTNWADLDRPGEKEVARGYMMSQLDLANTPMRQHTIAWGTALIENLGRMQPDLASDIAKAWLPQLREFMRTTDNPALGKEADNAAQRLDSVIARTGSRGK